MTGLDDAVERADYAMDDHYHAQEYLMDAIEDLESILDDLESSGTTAHEFERFANVVADYLEEDTERTARQAAKIEDLTDRLEDTYTPGGYEPGWQPGSPSWSPWVGQQQQQQWVSPGWNSWGQGWNTGWGTDWNQGYSGTGDESEWEEEWSDWNGWTDWSQGWNWSGGMFQSQSMGVGGMNQVQYVGVWY